MPLIVGDRADLHVQAVLAQIDTEATVLDAAGILASPVTITDSGLQIGGERVPASRGWLRRLAPEGWSETLNGRGADAAVRSAAVSTLAAVARDERVGWLTQLDNLGASENKPFQYRRAAAAGVPVPRWIVTTDVDAVPTVGQWVSKPLGPGSFIDGDGEGRVVPTAEVDLSRRDIVAAAPFILQERVCARAHARVVTVQSTVRSATLPAVDLPLDWRLAAEAHYSFTDEPAPELVHELALRAATSVGIGYSAQDWICDENGNWWLVDLNPAGQWLFLPNGVAAGITRSIARFLDQNRSA